MAWPTRVLPVAHLVRETAERFDELESAPVDALLERIGDARLVLLGEATHGTREFYRVRAQITRALVEKRGFSFVAVEADWPDAARIDDYVHGDVRRSKVAFTPFERFPTWMWRNEDVHAFVEWLRSRNAAHPESPVSFHGLDLYSLYTSIASVLAYLDDVDPACAAEARRRYGALMPWEHDPAAYGEAVLVGRTSSFEDAVVAMLEELLARRIAWAEEDAVRYFDAAQNARVVADAERYYRAMYHGGPRSWNLRDQHMFDTLESLLAFHGPGSKGVVWEHNSHVGDARATELGAEGELDVGELCRAKYGQGAYLVGFGTDHGTVAAASAWEAPMEIMQVRPAHGGSFEHVFHESGLPGLFLHLRDPARGAVRDELLERRLERAIGVVYRPDRELLSHYFAASLAGQFDEWIWIDGTHAVSPIGPLGPAAGTTGVPETYPFGT